MTRVLHAFAVSYEWFVYRMTENCYRVGGMIRQWQINLQGGGRTGACGKRLCTYKSVHGSS